MLDTNDLQALKMSLMKKMMGNTVPDDYAHPWRTIWTSLSLI